ncbi:MAG: TonB family protein [Deltaproteobacteria bacterium]|nr:TonB family protein [Deltaproteobacteria bacterium]
MVIEKTVFAQLMGQKLFTSLLGSLFVHNLVLIVVATYIDWEEWDEEDSNEPHMVFVLEPSEERLRQEGSIGGANSPVIVGGAILAQEPRQEPARNKTRPRIREVKKVSDAPSRPDIRRQRNSSSRRTSNTEVRQEREERARPKEREQAATAEVSIQAREKPKQNKPEDLDKTVSTQKTGSKSIIPKRRETKSASKYSPRSLRALSRRGSFTEPGIEEITGRRERVFHDYIVEMHARRIHPVFAETFLESLNKLGPRDPLNEWNLRTYIEIEISSDGGIDDMRVVLPSSVRSFDAAAVDTFYRAAPFPPPPRAIRSWNGKAYVRWGFFRNNRKCGLMNVEPFIVKKPKTYRTYAITR